jgi:hypothetical protein
MANVPSDFVNIQLSAAGIAAAGANGALRITAAHLSYQFTPGAPVRVLTSEWSKVLSRETLKGKTIFELAPAVVLTAAPVAAKPQTPVATSAPAATASQTAKEGK